MALADFQILVTSMVPADDRYTQMERDSAIALAVARYGQDVPLQLVEDVTWLAAGFFGPLPSSWAAGAYLVGAEYPIGQVPKRVLEVAQYVGPPSVMQLITTDALGAGAVVRVTFAVPHQLVAGASPRDTIALVHREAVSAYAAAVLCRQLATYYANERETSISADGSNTESRARNYAARAREYRQAYYAGIGKVDPQAASSGGGSAGVGDAAGAVTSWGSRSRGSLTRGYWS